MEAQSLADWKAGILLSCFWFRKSTRNFIKSTNFSKPTTSFRSHCKHSFRFLALHDESADIFLCFRRGRGTFPPDKLNRRAGWNFNFRLRWLHWYNHEGNFYIAARAYNIFSGCLHRSMWRRKTAFREPREVSVSLVSSTELGRQIAALDFNSRLRCNLLRSSLRA